MVQNTATVD